MTETAKNIASLRRQLAEARENLLLIQERKAEFVMGTSVPLDLIKEERRTERHVEELEQRLRELEQLTSTPSSSHTTSIGSVTGPVHTGTGDIHIEHYDANQSTGKYQVDAQDGQVGVIGDGTHVEGGIHFHAPPPPVPSPSQPETERYKVLSPDRIVWKKDGKEMVRVPAGKFLYGRKKKERELPEFWIDKTPVTNGEYACFVAATSHKPPKHWKGKTSPKGIVDHPVVNVSWHDAKAYAAWAGKFLPTEEEWEKAARGTDGRVYPWGNQKPTDRLCNFDNSGGGTTPVGKYSPQGDSPYGCVDMAGNVWDWTESKAGGRRVLRGGSFITPANDVRCAFGFTLRLNPFYRHWNLGFRVVVAAFSHQP